MAGVSHDIRHLWPVYKNIRHFWNSMLNTTDGQELERPTTKLELTKCLSYDKMTPHVILLIGHIVSPQEVYHQSLLMLLSLLVSSWIGDTCRNSNAQGGKIGSDRTTQSNNSRFVPSKKMLSKIVFSKFVVGLIWLSNTLFTPWLSEFQPPKDLAPKFSRDPQTLKLASTDFGRTVYKTPWAVFEPSSVSDISALISFSNSLSTPFTIATRGRAHSTLGQAMAQGDGVVLNMTNLINFRKGSGISVSCSPSGYCYADVGGEQLWIDVLHASLKHGLTPLSFANYLYLTVGGTLSNAGISGRAFRFGPQISNVLELDVVTGKGELVTCSPEKGSKLFFAALGGLGQFGVITRARIPLAPAPTRANQEYLTSFSERSDTNAPDFVNGELLFSNQNQLDLYPYPISDQQRIISLVTNHGIIYVLELVKYYDKNSQARAEEEVANLVKRLNFLPTFSFKSNASYEEFLDRVHTRELEDKPLGIWDLPHAWLDMFVPSSRISDVNEGALKGIVLKQNLSPGVCEIYPMNRNKLYMKEEKKA
ncbi:hypothetical protein Fmac_020621 [Flemingia macrophylla]|uniref:cytokinin dehydrogenase n=1 Tax=Flemingia macrophylla TaxID=520843 RepID=A0ABD1LUK3_9FABA